MTLKLRPHQSKAEDAIRESFRTGHKAPCLVVPTGGGKTEIACSILLSAVAKNTPSWFVAPRNALISQTYHRLYNYGIRAGVIQASNPLTDYSRLVQVCSKQTVTNRLQYIQHKPKLIIVDEAHEGAFGAEMTTLRASFPDALWLYMTATPYRLDGKGLGRFCDDLIEPTSVAELMSLKFLVPYRLFRGPAPDLTGISTIGGDYNEHELAERADTFELNGNLVRAYEKYGQSLPGLCFAINIEHSKHIAQRFRESGIPCDHIDSFQDDKSLDRSVARMKAGKIKIICSVGKLTTGFDCPMAKVAIMARPTQSLSLYLQMIGRVLRPEFKIAREGEHAIILDHADLIRKHGHAFEDQQWTLCDRPKRTENIDLRPTYSCPNCGEEFKSLPKICPCCDHIFDEKRQFEYVLPVELELDLEEDTEASTNLSQRIEYQRMLQSCIRLQNTPKQFGIRFLQLVGDYPRKVDMKGSPIHIKKIAGKFHYVDPSTLLPLEFLDKRPLFGNACSPSNLQTILDYCKLELQSGCKHYDIVKRSELYTSILTEDEQLQSLVASLVSRRIFSYDFETHSEQGTFFND
jgi:DNA repair protein RadD